MNWYLSKLVFQIICGNGDHTAQFDEQLRLIVAATKEEAFFKAQQIGKEEEESFYNSRQQLVRWQFINVCEVYKLHELINGTEVYSRIEERDDAENYIHVIHQKAERISNREQTRPPARLSHSGGNEPAGWGMMNDDVFHDEMFTTG